MVLPQRIGRRTEHPRMAKTQIGAVEQAAKLKIEQQSIAAQTEVLQNGMTSPAAVAFLNQLPAIAIR